MTHNCEVRTNYKLDLTFTTKQTGFPGASGKRSSCKAGNMHLRQGGSLEEATAHIHQTSGMCVHAQLLQSCPALCDHMDYSPGSCVHGLLQARYWSGLSCSPPGIFLLRDQTHVSASPAFQVDSLLSHLGSLNRTLMSYKFKLK